MSGTQTPPTSLVNLPLPSEMPHTWLDQIKSATKPGWWSGLLGSSLLATAISCGFSYFVSVKTIQANRKLEQEKSQRELRVEGIRSRSASYTNLARALDGLAAKLEVVVDLARIAQRSPMNATTVNRVREQLAEVGLAARSVRIAERDPILNGTDVSKAAEDCMSKLSPAIAAAQKEPFGHLEPLEDSLKTLQQLIAQIEDQILKDINGVS
jgi:hypothetical protein